MSESYRPAPHFWGTRALVHTLVLSLLAGPWLPVLAAPSQKPLLSRTPGKADPNIFYTIDDSGSMSFSHAPDNVWAGMSNNIFPIMHPSDNLTQITNLVPANYQIRQTCVVRTDVNSSFGASNLRLRSPQFNKIYYDPTVTYRPWARANPTDLEYPNSSFTAARIDPRYIINSADPDASNAVVNLSTTSNSYQPPAPNDWCTSSSWNDDNNRPFNPAVYFRFNLNPATATTTQINSTANYTLVNLNDATAFANDAIASAKAAGRTDCVSVAGKCTITEERQNFANWFTYYRTRSLLARGATSRAFARLNDPFRLGYGAINYSGSAVDGISGAPSQTVRRGVRDFTVGSSDRSNFFSWLYTVGYYGGTPLRRAMDDVGRYFTLKDSKGPWGKDPGIGTEAQTSHLSCRKSYHILMTDGYWNGAAATVNSTNWDGITGTTIADNSKDRTYQYRPDAKATATGNPPYADNVTGTLADVAQYYWMTDLRPDIKNNLTVDMVADDPTRPYYDASAKIDRLDHAFWQHLTTFTVGLGISGTKDYTQPAPPQGGWPTPAADAATAVDDLWHAAVNGRGKYLQASNPQQFQDALEDALNEIFASQSTPSGVSVSAFNITSGSKKYVPSFVEPQWFGDVTAYSIANLNSQSVKWTASAQLPPAANRNIFIWNGTQATAFNTSLATGVRTAFSNWGLATTPSNDVINYLRGDRSLEGSTFRCRGDLPGATSCTTLKESEKNKGLIGDIVNSQPVLVKNNVNLSYQLLPASDPGRGSYLSHVASKKSRTTGALMFGANDGMLHVLNDETGAEVFAFIPQGVTANLGRLTDRNYGGTVNEDAATAHRFFVDGPLTESDAYLNGAWTNVVVGTTGAGGKSVFALKVDTTNPLAMDASSVMWEINPANTILSSAQAERDKLGHVTSPVKVGRLKNGEWAAIFGNGMDSASGRAYLMIVNLRTGALIKAIPAGTATGNGLGGVSLVLNNERVVVAAYAGDNQGKLWRFDLHSDTAGNWGVGLGGKALFSPVSGQAITAAPAYLPHPRGGLMVLFGTGRLYASGDENNTQQQTVYGIWDPTLIGQPSSGSPSEITESLLLQQDILPPVNVDGTLYYPVTKRPIAWTGTSKKSGWFVRQSILAGQRVVADPYVLSGLAFVNTVAPTQPIDACEEVQSKNYILILDPYTGGAPNVSLIDTNNDGVVDSKDVPIGAKETDGEGEVVGDDDGRLGPDDPLNAPCSKFQTSLALIDSGQGPGDTLCAPKPYTQRNWQQIHFFPR